MRQQHGQHATSTLLMLFLLLPPLVALACAFKCSRTCCCSGRRVRPALVLPYCCDARHRRCSPVWMRACGVVRAGRARSPARSRATRPAGASCHHIAVVVSLPAQAAVVQCCSLLRRAAPCRHLCPRLPALAAREPRRARCSCTPPSALSTWSRLRRSRRRCSCRPARRVRHRCPARRAARRAHSCTPCSAPLLLLLLLVCVHHLLQPDGRRVTVRVRCAQGRSQSITHARTHAINRAPKNRKRITRSAAA